MSSSLLIPIPLSTLHSLSSFFFNDTPTTQIYTLSLHDALPISSWAPPAATASATGQPISTVSTAWSTAKIRVRSEEHTSELQSHSDLVCRLLLEKKKNRLQLNVQRQ